VRDAEFVVVLGHDETRGSTGQHQPVDNRGVGVALCDNVGARPGHRQAQGVVALGGAVGEEERPLGAIRAGGQAFGSFVRRRRWPRVDALNVLGQVGGQCVDPDRLA
jgi:hypothetical protein